MKVYKNYIMRISKANKIIRVTNERREINACKTGGNTMRISKSTKKSVKATTETGNSNIPTYKLAKQIAETSDWESAGFSSKEEFLARKKEAQEILKKKDSVTSCNSSTSTDQALKHIKAAIDILGKSGSKDEITKDSIANLGVVMFDLQGKRK